MDSLLDDDIATEIELMVDMSCQKCVDDISEKLKSNLKSTKVIGADIEAQRIIVRGNDLTIDVIDTIKTSTGRNASVAGFGSKGSAVCAIGVAEGWEKGCGGAGGVGSEGVYGVIRLIEIETTKHNGILFEGRIGGLPPYSKHSLAVHQYGNLTNGCENVGNMYIPQNNNNNNTNFNGILGTSIANKDGQAQFRVLNEEYKDFWSLIGRSIVLHSLNPDGKTLDKRIACGIICRAATIGQNPKKICPCDNQPTVPINSQEIAPQSPKL